MKAHLSLLCDLVVHLAIRFRLRRRLIVITQIPEGEKYNSIPNYKSATVSTLIITCLCVHALALTTIVIHFYSAYALASSPFSDHEKVGNIYQAKYQLTLQIPIPTKIARLPQRS